MVAVCFLILRIGADVIDARATSSFPVLQLIPVNGRSLACSSITNMQTPDAPRELDDIFFCSVEPLYIISCPVGNMNLMALHRVLECPYTDSCSVVHFLWWLAPSAGKTLFASLSMSICLVAGRGLLSHPFHRHERGGADEQCRRALRQRLHLEA